MLRNIFNFVLAITFIVLVALYAYKVVNKPEITKVPLNDSKKQTKENIVKSKETISSYSKEEIEAIVKNYIIDNPDVLVTSLENMHKKKVMETTEKANKYLENNRNKIETSGNPPILGNKNGDISIVVFYDYNCAFCKKANTKTNNIISSDPGVKIILRPIPILGGTSLYAAKTSLALQKISEEKFPAIHNDMMQMQVLDETSIKKLMEKYNIDYSIVENEINSYATKQLIAKNYDLARSLNISGAPFYIINGIFVPGFIPEDKFKQIILQIRASEESATDNTKETLNEESNTEPKK